MKIELQQNLWHSEEPVILDLPDDWEVTHDTMLCDKVPKLTPGQIRAKIEAPLGGPSLAEMAKGKQRVCIIFDDMSRPTPSRELAEPVLDILLSAGVKKDQIIFMSGTGNHGALTREDFVKKLGEEIVAEYFVYNHNPYENLTCIGKAKRGFDVLLNKEVAQCDLLVGLGAMLPHAANGFSGGYKLLFPGVAGIDTMTQIHGYSGKRRMEAMKAAGAFIPVMGHETDLSMVAEMEECGRMAPPFFKVDCFVNTRREIIDVFAGEPSAAFHEAAKTCKGMYEIERPEEADIVIVNSNMKSNESNVAYGAALQYYMKANNKNGDIVLVNFAKSGQVPHYMIGHFGRTTKARMCNPGRDPRQAGKTIYYSPYGDKSGMDEIKIDPSRYVWKSTWEGVMEALTKKGPGTKVLVIDEGAVATFKDA